jgi:hypothetical protein
MTTNRDNEYESLGDFELAGLAVDRRLGVNAQKRTFVGGMERYEYMIVQEQFRRWSSKMRSVLGKSVRQQLRFSMFIT